MLSALCVGKAFHFWSMTQNRQAHEMEHQLSIAAVDSDGWKQMEFCTATQHSFA